MRDIQTKVDNVDTLSGDEFNANLKSELQNVVTGTGQTLDPSVGPDSDLNMFGKAMSVYGSASEYYQESGTANAYVLSRSTTLQPLSSYIDGMVVMFKTSNANTGASTVNVSGLGIKSIQEPDGTALTSGRIKSNAYVTARYNLSSDRFEIVNTDTKVVSTIITASTTYSPSSAVKSIRIKAIGGGGGGGGVDGQGGGTSALSGAGGGGGASELLTDTVDASYTIVIGAGGAGGLAGVNGVDGGDTTVTSLSVNIIAGGGGGGTGEIGGAGYGGGNGGDGGVSSGGDINSKGGDATSAYRSGGTPTSGSLSGSSILGGSLDTSGTGIDGIDATVYGLGGGACLSYNSTANGDGGNGFQGVVIIEEYY